MAIYHLHTRIIGRSKAQRVVASAAYRRAERLYDNQLGQWHDYTAKRGVAHSELSVPARSPEWLKELVALRESDKRLAVERFWNLVEAHEKRHNAQLARELEFSLPIELTQAQNIVLARAFLEEQCVTLGMVVDWSMHWDKGNPHVHALLTMRSLTDQGFGLKVRTWNRKTQLVRWRAQWAAYANFHLRLHQHAVRIDNRSYAEQGIGLLPTVHQGRAVIEMTKRGILTDRAQEANAVCRENIKRIAQDPSVLCDKLVAQCDTFTTEDMVRALGSYLHGGGQFCLEDTLGDNGPIAPVLSPQAVTGVLACIEQFDSVFSERELRKAVMPYTQNAEDFAHALLQVKRSADVLPLGAGDDGRERYTTRRLFRLENTLQRKVAQLHARRHKDTTVFWSSAVLPQYEKQTGKTLTEEQLAAVHHLVKPSAVACLVGRAGTGKSFSLGAARAVWESYGLNVQGVALSGVAAEGLSREAGIPSRTIDSFRYRLATGRATLTRRDVVVMDEAGMADTVSMAAVVDAVHKAKAKLVLVGDPAQLPPVGPGASFRALLPQCGFAELQTVSRQTADWQREATADFAASDVKQGLSAYAERQCVHFLENEELAMSALVRNWWKTHEEGTALSDQIVIAHRNKDVQALNRMLRQKRIQQQEITEGYPVPTAQGEISLAVGDRLVFLKNDARLGVRNGQFGTVASVVKTRSLFGPERVSYFTVIVDGSDGKQPQRVHPEVYGHFAHGYAATVHKVQGGTFHWAFVYVGGKGWQRYLVYVALSRHRKGCQVYVDKHQYPTFDSLAKQLGRLFPKDSTLDFPLAFAEQRGIDGRSLFEKIGPAHLTKRLAVLRDKVVAACAHWKDPALYQAKQVEKAQRQEAIEEQAQRREDAKTVAAYVDANRAVGRAWGEIQSGNASKTKTERQTALEERAQLAKALLTAPEKYTEAMALHQVETQKLKVQAAAYKEKQAAVPSVTRAPLTQEQEKHYVMALKELETLYKKSEQTKGNWGHAFHYNRLEEKAGKLAKSDAFMQYLQQHQPVFAKQVQGLAKSHAQGLEREIE